MRTVTAIVKRISHDGLVVRILRSARDEKVSAGKQLARLAEELKAGDRIKVRRETNNPFPVYVEKM